MNGVVNVKIIGLTGPTGAGKSELCAILSRHGIPSINADRIYHNILTPPSACLDALSVHFGKGIIKSDGTLDRRALANIVFADGAEKEHEALNRITHGFVKEKMHELISEYSKAACPAVIADVPLLFESEFDRECDFTVAVLANRAIRTERIMKRDSLDYSTATQRINAQQSDDFYIERATFTVYNNLGSAELESEAQKIMTTIGGVS